MNQAWLLPITLTLLLGAVIFLLAASILERVRSRQRKLEDQVRRLAAELEQCRKALSLAEQKVATLAAAQHSSERQHWGRRAAGIVYGAGKDA